MESKLKKLNQRINLLRGFIFMFLAFAFPFFANAQIIITEIMYNPEDSDTGKEWIEIYNNGTDEVDLTDWKLFEADTNHKIKPVEEGGSLVLPADSFSLIVDKVDKFKENYQTFSGLVFDSAYSLSNTGEVLILRNGNLSNIDSVSYSSDLGADGDGNSLQLVDGIWISASPTMGKTNNSLVDNDQENQQQDNGSENEEGVFVDFPITPQVFAYAGKDRKIIAGADTMFEAVGLGTKKEPLKNARYSWSFGDGSLIEGQRVLYSYKYPSRYIVVLNISSGEHTASDRIVVEALPADIVITEINQTEGFIELHNRSSYELNLSWWRLRSGNEYFSLPKDTIILADNKIRLFNKITGFSYLDLNNVYLLYPNGEVVNKYNSTPVVSSVRLHERSEAIQEVVKTQNTGYQGLSNKTQVEENTNLDDRMLGVKEQEDQLAFVGEVVGREKRGSGLFNKWTFTLFGLVLVSIVGVLFMRGLEKEDIKEESDDGLKPEDFKIIE